MQAFSFAQRTGSHVQPFKRVADSQFSRTGVSRGTSSFQSVPLRFAENPAPIPGANNSIHSVFGEAQ
jgi:hypothetical protein